GLLVVVALLLLGVSVASSVVAMRMTQLATSEEQARLDAERDRETAVAVGDVERWGRYRSNIAAASAALQLQDSGTARRVLDDAPEQHRDWEWRYLHSQLDGASLVMRVPGGTMSELVLSPAGRQVAVCSADRN